MVQYVEQTYDRAHISKREKKKKWFFPTNWIARDKSQLFSLIIIQSDLDFKFRIWETRQLCEYYVYVICKICVICTKSVRIYS